MENRDGEVPVIKQRHTVKEEQHHSVSVSTVFSPLLESCGDVVESETPGPSGAACPTNHHWVWQRADWRNTSMWTC